MIAGEETPMRRRTRALPLCILLGARLLGCAPLPGVAIAQSPAPASSPTPAMPASTPDAPRPTPTARPAWVAFGDSIMQDTFRPPLDWPLTVLNLAERGDTSQNGTARLEGAIARAPEGGAVFAVGFGTNDAYAGVSVEAFRANMKAIASRLAAGGRTPFLGQIPGSADPRLAPERILPYNRALRELETELGLAKGPDLATYFQAHPEELLPDGVHLSAEGVRSARRLWSRAAKDAGLPGF